MEKSINYGAEIAGKKALEADVGGKELEIGLQKNKESKNIFYSNDIFGAPGVSWTRGTRIRNPFECIEIIE